MKKTVLRKSLLSAGRRLLITADGLAAAMMEAFPLAPGDGIKPASFFFDPEPPTYHQETNDALQLIMQQLHASSQDDVSVTDEFTSPELPEGTVAYHRVWGFITADSRWYFSSKQLEADLMAAECNPAISCHFLHINSPGGEAWYLDRLSETMRGLAKPVVALVEQCACSAAYYIGCHAGVIAALTANDEFGCIGTMVETYDFTEYYNKLGIKHILERSSYSDLKNKMFEDLRAGKPEQYIREVLDPLTLQFVSEVKACRPALSQLDMESPVLRGETYDTAHAIENGLADCVMSLPEAVARAASMGREWMEMEKLKKSALNYV